MRPWWWIHRVARPSTRNGLGAARSPILALAALAALLSPGVASAQSPECDPNSPQYNPLLDPDQCNCDLPIPTSFTRTVTVPAQTGDLQLELTCSPPPGLPEAKTVIRNTSHNKIYKVRVRTQVVCPPDAGQAPTCMCPQGYQDWFDVTRHTCNDYPCNDGTAPASSDFTRYPKQLPGPGQQLPPPTCGADPNVTCAQEGDWLWCELQICPESTVNPGNLRPLNSCCDCDNVRKNILCGHVDTLAWRRTNQSSWTTVTDPAYDVQGECRSEAFLHDVDAVSFTCFQPLASTCPQLSASAFARPAGPACQTSSLFMFDAVSPSPQLQCRIDGGGFASCSSPYTVSLPAGPHVFYVRDGAAADPTTDRYAWTIDPNAACGPGDTAFHLTKTIVGGDRVNLVSLPFENGFQGSGGPERICQAFGLGSTATVRQYNGLGATYIHQCGADPAGEPNPFPNNALLDHPDFKGVEIREPAAVTRKGYIEGREIDGQSIRIEDLGGGTVGKNLFPVLYHGTAVTPLDLCNQCGLSAQAQITRFDAATGQVLDHVCGQQPQWNLVVGEAVLIQEPNGPKTCVQPHY